ncbi:MAG: dihydropteroate synthase [Bdellovibrionota bacterium]
MSTLRIGSKSYDLTNRGLVAGILNVTPDSFSDGGRYQGIDAAVAHAKALVAQGADIIDVGGESTRPGAKPVSIEEETYRVVPVIEAIREAGVSVPISVDTRKSEVAALAVGAGAQIVNDVSALSFDPKMKGVVKASGAAVILMHNRGTPEKMYERADYTDVVEDVRKELAASLETALAAGIAEDRIVLDPGIGFAKKAEHSWKVLDGLARIVSLGRPVLVGTSRKSFLKEVFGEEPEALERGTQATCVAAMVRGARLFRVHEPAPLRDLALCRRAA